MPVHSRVGGQANSVRSCSEAVASMAAIESTIDSRVNRLLGDFIEKMVGA